MQYLTTEWSGVLVTASIYCVGRGGGPGCGVHNVTYTDIQRQTFLIYLCCPVQYLKTDRSGVLVTASIYCVGHRGGPGYDVHSDTYD